MITKIYLAIFIVSLYIPLVISEKVENQADGSLSPAIFEQLVFDFMKLRHRKAGVIFTCGRPMDLVYFVKSIGEQTDLSIVVKDISKAVTAEGEVRKCLPFKTPVAAVLNLNCNNDAQRIIRMASDLSLFNEIHPWLVLGNDVSEAVSYFSEINLNIDTSLMFVTPYRSGAWIAYDLWNPGFHQGGYLNITLYAFINTDKTKQNVGMPSNSGYCGKRTLFPESLVSKRWAHDNATIVSVADIDKVNKFNREIDDLYTCVGDTRFDIDNYMIATTDQLKFVVDSRWIIFLYDNWVSRRSNFQGIKINTIVAIGNRRLDRTIEHYLTHNYDPRFNIMQRHGVKLFNYLMEIYNFRIHMIRTNKWGPATSGRGVTSALLSGQAELSGVPTEYKRNRIGLMDYTHPTWKCDFAVIFRDPLGVPAADGFLKPLSSSVWFCSLGCTLLAAFLYRATSRMEVGRSYEDVSGKSFMLLISASCMSKVNEMSEQNVLVERGQSARSVQNDARKIRSEDKLIGDIYSTINLYRFPNSIIDSSVLGKSTTAMSRGGVPEAKGDLKSDDTSHRMPEDIEIPLDRVCMEKPWGNFYIYPQLYQDKVSPMVRIKDYHDLKLTKNEEAGLLSVRIIATRISYISRNPLNGGYVAIKLSLGSLNLKNIDVLKTYRFVQYLDLSRNYLTTLVVLNYLPYLQYLVASYNQLPELLDYDKAQWFLTEVHFRFNLVSVIRDMKAFWSITVLDLSHNNIKVINGLKELRFLRRLDLSFNHIQCLENLNEMRLKWLDVSYNRISGYECTQSVGLWTLQHLEYLNINENMLTSLKILDQCHRLRELHCRNNRISDVLEVTLYLRHLLKLRSLDLRENPISTLVFYHQIVLRTFPALLQLDGVEVDIIEKATAKMEADADIMTYVNRRLFRMLALQQLSMPHVGPHVPVADSRDPPLIVLAGPPATFRGTLCRRLAAEHPKKVFKALLHTTAACRPEDREAPLFHHVSVTKFNEMLIAGKFIAYFEEEGDSFGLSGLEVVKSLSSSPPRACITAMSHVGALLLRARGLRPHLVLTIRQDEEMRRSIIRRRRGSFEEYSMAGYPSDVSMLHLSARIYIGGILQEILLNVHEHSLRSECPVDWLVSLSQTADSYEVPTFRTANESDVTEPLSLCSLYKYSDTATGDRWSDPSLPTVKRASAIKSGNSNTKSDVPMNGFTGKNVASRERRPDSEAKVSASTRPAHASALKSRPQRKSDISKSKIVDFGSSTKNTIDIYGPASTGQISNCRSVTFQTQGSLENMIIDPETSASKGAVLDKSISKKISYLRSPHSAQDDLDLWLDFVTEAGLATISEVFSKTAPEDIPKIPIQQTQSLLAQVDNLNKIYAAPHTAPPHSSEQVHVKYPGVFSDTLIVDDLGAAYKQLKNIVKKVMNEQSLMEPLYDVDFNQMDLASVNHRLDMIQKDIAPCRMPQRPH